MPKSVLRLIILVQNKEKTMSKYSVKNLWNEIYGKKEEAYDYAGRLMLKSACGNPNSAYQPTIDHVRPLSNGGKDTKANIVLCHYETNEEKGNSYPHWKANDRRYHAKKKSGVSNGYEIVREE